MMQEINSFIKGVFEAAETVRQGIDDTQRKIEYTIKKFQKRLLIMIIEAMMFFIGGIILLIGILLYLSRFVSMDILLIITGSLLLYTAILIKLFRR
ncbi:MAG: hypothetical protein ACMXYL_02270 [Candidatus Woesearchaeota archaeon]